MANKSKNFSIRVTEKVYELLERIANDKGISRNELIGIAILFYCKHYIKAKKHQKGGAQ